MPDTPYKNCAQWQYPMITQDEHLNWMMTMMMIVGAGLELTKGSNPFLTAPVEKLNLLCK